MHSAEELVAPGRDTTTAPLVPLVESTRRSQYELFPREATDATIESPLATVTWGNTTGIWG